MEVGDHKENCNFIKGDYCYYIASKITCVFLLTTRGQPLQNSLFLIPKRLTIVYNQVTKSIMIQVPSQSYS
jgi:hypothetical protein